MWHFFHSPLFWRFSLLFEKLRYLKQEYEIILGPYLRIYSNRWTRVSYSGILKTHGCRAYPHNVRLRFQVLEAYFFVLRVGLDKVTHHTCTMQVDRRSVGHLTKSVGAPFDVRNIHQPPSCTYPVAHSPFHSPTRKPLMGIIKVGYDSVHRWVTA